MKAKQYFEFYKTSNDKEKAINEILDSFLKEVDTLAIARRSTSPETYSGIINELDKKWRAFASMAADQIKPTAFSDYARFKMPGLVGEIQNVNFIEQRQRGLEMQSRLVHLSDHHKAILNKKEKRDFNKGPRKANPGAK